MNRLNNSDKIKITVHDTDMFSINLMEAKIYLSNDSQLIPLDLEN